jgi:hypothetical protein
MAVSMSVYSQTIREGMEHYWRVVNSTTDDGLEDYELEWKRDHERDMARMEEKFGHAYADLFAHLRALGYR